MAKDEIAIRITMARNAFLRLKILMPSQNHYENECVYIAAIRLILLCGCETWAMRVEVIKKLFSFDQSYLKFYRSAKRIKL